MDDLRRCSDIRGFNMSSHGTSFYNVWTRMSNRVSIILLASQYIIYYITNAYLKVFLKSQRWYIPMHVINDLNTKLNNTIYAKTVREMVRFECENECVGFMVEHVHNMYVGNGRYKMTTWRCTTMETEHRQHKRQSKVDLFRYSSERSVMLYNTIVFNMQVLSLCLKQTTRESYTYLVLISQYCWDKKKR